MNYRFNVLFSHKASAKEYLVPGYFAADVNAGNTSAEKGSAEVDLSSASGKMKLLWFNPRTGGKLQKESVKSFAAGSKVDPGNSPDNDGMNWVVLVK